MTPKRYWINSKKVYMSLENRLLEAQDIKPEQVWFSCDGAGIRVTIDSVDSENQVVRYSWEEDGQIVRHSKSSFAFQCRYYLPDYSELESTDRTVCRHFHEPTNCWECDDEQNKNQKLKHIVILGKKGVTSDMEFICTDCNERIHGGRILSGEYLYIVERNPTNAANSRFRCECCQDDFEDREQN